MKSVTQGFKNALKSLGKELDVKITLVDSLTELNSDIICSCTPHYQGNILKSVMKQLDIVSTQAIQKGTLINCQIGVKVGISYEYLDFGNYIVNNVEIDKSTELYTIIAYDKMLYAMTDYEQLSITYPITTKNYLIALCTKLGLQFDTTITFTNQDKLITKELYLDSDGNSLSYKNRNVFDELAVATAGTICIDSNDNVTIKYITNSNETIDEDLVKNVNAEFGKLYGPINSLILSRSGGLDSIEIKDDVSIASFGKTSIKIVDNQLLNLDDRAEWGQNIFDKIKGTSYYLNDYESIGFGYLELCDRYNVSINDTSYSCVMLNDEFNVGDGMNEIIYSNEPEQNNNEYSNISKNGIEKTKTEINVDKQGAIIKSLVEKVVDVSNTISGTGSIELENAHKGILHYLSIKGNISQLVPSNSLKPNNNLKPIGPTLLIDNDEYTLDIDILRYINNTLCDEFIYEDGECYIIRRIDSNGNELEDEVIEPRNSIILNIEENSAISLKSFNNVIFKCEYLLENVYTDNFATQIEVKSEIIQTENSIEQKVSSVADENGNITSGSIILALNKDESEATINASKIKLEGYTTINDGFSVDLEGNMTARSGDIGGWKLSKKGLSNNEQFINNNGYSNIYTYADMVILRNYILNNLELSDDEIDHYDLNGDGVVNSVDLLLMRKKILGIDEGDE